jgi:hypothetical protein
MSKFEFRNETGNVIRYSNIQRDEVRARPETLAIGGSGHRCHGLRPVVGLR